MAFKKDLKVSEARIIVLLSQIGDLCRYTGAIAAKLNMDYNYAIHILAGMIENKWITKKAGTVKIHYFLTRSAPLTKAKRLLEVEE